MNRRRVRRAWPLAVASILAACLALRVVSDFAWVLALACLVGAVEQVPGPEHQGFGALAVTPVRVDT